MKVPEVLLEGWVHSRGSWGRRRGPVQGGTPPRPLMFYSDFLSDTAQLETLPQLILGTETLLPIAFFYYVGGFSEFMVPPIRLFALCTMIYDKRGVRYHRLRGREG